ncbi:MAG: 4Fe-4S dicluster domain-containing protein [Velocimicrobium sp.]
MLKEDSTIGNVKYAVLKRVAELSFDGKLEENIDQIPFELIPGPQANFRCCIYREREIIRQRVRLAQGKSPSANQDNKNIVQVINSACEGCPIARFSVTNNCQKCMSKKCQQACNFGAINMGNSKAHIDPKKCKECGKCVQACPYNAIADLMRPCKRSCPVDAIKMDENGIVVIDEEKCIQCGSCIKDCPFGAIADRSFLVDVIHLLREEHVDVYAMVAPAIEGKFGADASIASLRSAIMDLGFKDMYEVALGADMVAKSEAMEWAEAYNDGKKMTTSCCPAFVNMIKMHFPQLIENMSTTVSPMAAVSRMIKSKDKNAVTVFIGPCIAKKSEVIDSVGTNNADYALTFEELRAMFAARQIHLEEYEAESIQQGSVYGKEFARAGGVTAAVLEALNEEGANTDINVRQCNGAAECKKALMLLKVSKLPEDFIEGMACVGGCVNGPGTTISEQEAKKDRATLLGRADKRSIEENLKEYRDHSFSMHRA